MAEAMIRKYKREKPKETILLHNTVESDFKKILVPPQALSV